jgi:proteasome accessory factor A
LILEDAVVSTREVSHSPDGPWLVRLENGKTVEALEVQWRFLDAAGKYLQGRDPEIDWLLENWSFTLESLETNPMALVGGVDWITKRWLLETFAEAEGLKWDDPWLLSLDLEYHNIDPARGLFFQVKGGKRIADWNQSVRIKSASYRPPNNSRAAGRSQAVAQFRESPLPYVINWDSIASGPNHTLIMSDPYETYAPEVSAFLREVKADA